MAAVYGVNYTKTTNTPRDMIDAREWHGRLRVQYDSYEAAALASGSTIAVAKLPAGTHVVGWMLQTDALGSGVTLALGDSGDADRLMAATSFASATTKSSFANGFPIATGPGFITTAETTINLTTAGASATGTIYSWIFYTVD